MIVDSVVKKIFSQVLEEQDAFKNHDYMKKEDREGHRVAPASNHVVVVVV